MLLENIEASFFYSQKEKLKFKIRKINKWFWRFSIASLRACARETQDQVLDFGFRRVVKIYKAEIKDLFDFIFGVYSQILDKFSWR